MTNRSMARKIAEGECLDLAKIGAVEVRPGVYEMQPGSFVDDVDYCHGPTEQWIWSIGRELSTGKIFADVAGSFYLNNEFECLWLR